MSGQSSAQKTQGSTSIHCPWLKRIGVVGFLFFLVKGILWLVVPTVLVILGLTD